MNLVLKKSLSFLFSIILIFSFFPEGSSQPVNKEISEASKDLIKSLKFEGDIPLAGMQQFSSWKNGWYVMDGVTKDTVNPAEGKYALKIESQERSMAIYYLGAGTIEGDSVTYSGKYRFEDAVNAKIEFKIEQLTRYVAPSTDIQTLELSGQNGSSGWKSFLVKSKLQEGTQGILFPVYTEGKIKLWIDDLDIRVDARPLTEAVKVDFQARNDNEFDEGSNIQFNRLTAQTIENLDVLARVWGFLTHYHPKATMGDINMDYELFRIMPLVADAKDKQERSRIINDWIIRSLGKITKTKDYSIEDPSLYSRIINLDWINNRKLFSPELIQTLNDVKNAERSNKFNYNVIIYSGSKRVAYMDPKSFYPDISWEDQGFRLLSLFKAWNNVEYGFPYVELMDKPWREILTGYIQPFATAGSQREYELLLLSLMAHVQDSHSQIFSDGNGLFHKLWVKKNNTFTDLVKTEDGKVVVQSFHSSGLVPGDIIISVDGKDIQEVINEMRPYVIASNEDGIFNKVKRYLLQTDEDSLTVVVERDKEKFSYVITDFTHNASFKAKHKKPEDYSLASQKIIYIDGGNTLPNDVESLVKNNLDADGFIFDLREYPKGYLFNNVNPYLLPDTVRFMWFSSCELDYPGNFILYNKEITGKENNEDYFKGKVAILVNDGTISLGEMVAIALRYAPQSKVIGSTTAGADGNNGFFVLPGSNFVTLTTIGAYYPGWEVCQ